MTDEMIEAVALAIARVVDGNELVEREIADKEGREYVVRLYKDEAKAAIEAARPFIKEECAKVADKEADTLRKVKAPKTANGAMFAASAIRAK